MTNAKTIKMTVGEMNVYEFNGIQLHAYKTKDPLDDEVFIVVNGKQAFTIELPAFKNNVLELTEYINTLGVEVVGKLVAYHAAGASFLPGVKTIMTDSAKAFNTNGGGAALVGNFTGVFGESFDGTIAQADEIIGAGTHTIAGVTVEIIPNGDAYEIVLPQLNAVYMHMLGHDCHSIVGGAGHADAIIADLEGYLARGIDMILTSHYTPETQKDVKEKIAYLSDLKVKASACKNASEFKEVVKKAYSQYSGENYLDMTVGMFFPN